MDRLAPQAGTLGDAARPRHPLPEAMHSSSRGWTRQYARRPVDVPQNARLFDDRTRV